MKRLLIITLLLSIVKASADQRELVDKFYDGLEVVRDEYRKDFSKELQKCDRVSIFLLDFDDITENDGLFVEREKERIRIARYGSKFVAILKKRELEESERELILSVLAEQIAKEEQYGGAFCHLPIHGIRAYYQDQLVFESTFCWVCSNFGFEYPEGAQWLDTNIELEDAFKQFMPIPASEVERFQKKYGPKEPKGEINRSSQ